MSIISIPTVAGELLFPFNAGRNRWSVPTYQIPLAKTVNERFHFVHYMQRKCIRYKVPCDNKPSVYRPFYLLRENAANGGAQCRELIISCQHLNCD